MMYKTNKTVADNNSNYNRADVGGKSVVEAINEIATDQTRLNNLVKELEGHLAKSKKNNDTDMANFYQEFPLIEAFVRQEIFENGKYYRINTRSAVSLAKFFFMAGIKWTAGGKSLKSILKWK